jgi:hypothetical protein
VRPATPSFSSPFPWYSTSQARASSVRPTAASQRGLSGTNLAEGERSASGKKEESGGDELDSDDDVDGEDGLDEVRDPPLPTVGDVGRSKGDPWRTKESCQFITLF